MSDVDDLRRDLADEQHALDDVVAPLTDADWARPTASPGWTVRDQIGHLAYFDAAAALAITDPVGFAGEVESLMTEALAAGGSPDEWTLAAFRARTPTELLVVWRANRDDLDRAAAGLSPTARVPWYGPSMGARSFLTARLMEVWAHGTDVADAVGVHLPATARLRHIAQLGFLTRGWSYTVRGEEPPVESVALDLTGPDGERWSWGPADATDVVSGPAEEFCLVITQRRHLQDTRLEAGATGRHWLERAQAFAGGATTGPAPREA